MAATVAATVAERGVERAATRVAEARVVVAVVGETEVAMAMAARVGERVAVPMGVKRSPAPVPLGALLLPATQLPQVALPRLEQRGDIHLALRHRRHRGRPLLPQLGPGSLHRH